MFSYLTYLRKITTQSLALIAVRNLKWKNNYDIKRRIFKSFGYCREIP